MGILNPRAWLMIAAFAVGVHAWASGEDMAPDPHDLAVEAQAKSLCSSTDEYIKTLKFLRDNKELEFPEATSRLIAEKVFARLRRGERTLQPSFAATQKRGAFGPQKSRNGAGVFEAKRRTCKKTFPKIFTRSFLGEFFDYDYATAARLAYELSKNYKGEPAQVREDFIELVRYCKDGKTLDLPTKLCAELTIKTGALESVLSRRDSQTVLPTVSRLARTKRIFYST